MYSQFVLPTNHALKGAQLSFQKCIIAANWSMVLSIGLVICSLLMSFHFDSYLPITMQITAHIGTIVFAAIFKLAYVVRCVGVYGLGYRVF